MDLKFEDRGILDTCTDGWLAEVRREILAPDSLIQNLEEHAGVCSKLLPCGTSCLLHWFALQLDSFHHMNYSVTV